MKNVNELYHHGILGQKWGKRNGPPYPLDPEDHSASEKKAGWRKSLSDDEKIDIVRKNSKLEQDRKIDSYYAELKKTAKAVLDDPDVQAGLKAAAVILAAYGAYKIGAPLLKDAGMEFLDRTFGSTEALRTNWNGMVQDSVFNSLDELPKSKTNYFDDYMNSTSDTAYTILTNNVNNGWPDAAGRTNNCMLCTTSIVMKLKGYDVSAETSDNGWSMKQVSDWFEGATVTSPHALSYKSLMKQMAESGDGSYGNFAVQWKTGGGHSIFYIVKDGKVHFIDGQANLEYNPKKLFKHADILQSKYVRLDNCEPKEAVIGALSENLHNFSGNSKTVFAYRKKMGSK